MFIITEFLLRFCFERRIYLFYNDVCYYFFLNEKKEKKEKKKRRFYRKLFIRILYLEIETWKLNRVFLVVSSNRSKISKTFKTQIFFKSVLN